MKKMILRTTLLMAAVLALPMSANAVLLGRDISGAAVAGNDVDAVFLYDDVLNVTWLRDANANGAMSWAQANSWAASLAVGDYNGWRLPTMIDTGTAGCVENAFSGTDCGFNVQTKSGNLTTYEPGQTVYSEMAHLFYVTLGNKAYFDTSGNLQAGYGLTNTGDFQKLPSPNNSAGAYWSGLEAPILPPGAWLFNTNDGMQTAAFQEGPSGYFAFAVLDGDVLVSAVPEPETYALMLVGLAAVGAAARRRQSVNGGSKRAAP